MILISQGDESGNLFGLGNGNKGLGGALQTYFQEGSFQPMTPVDDLVDETLRGGGQCNKILNFIFRDVP